MFNQIRKLFIDALNIYENKFYLVTHKNCTDGSGAVAAVFDYCDRNDLIRPIVIPMQYGDDFTIDVTDCNVLMCDFSFDIDTMITIYNKSNRFVCLDHHKSAKETISSLPYCKFNMDKSGARLAWDFFNEDIEPPALIKYIEDRDLWNWKLENSHEYNAGISVIDNNDYEKFVTLMDDKIFATLLSAGSAILSYQEQYINKVKFPLDTNKTTYVKFAGYTVPIDNNTHLISERGNRMAVNNPFSIQYFITKDRLVLSFRSDNNVDLTKLEIPNGHPNAAGYSIELSKVDISKMLSADDVSDYLLSLSEED